MTLNEDHSAKAPKASASSATAALIVDLIKSSMWPFIVLLGMALFYSPLKETLNSIANQSQDIQAIKLGTFELDVRAKDLPTPSKELAGVLSSLDEQMLTELTGVKSEQEREVNVCYSITDGPGLTAKRKLAILKLIALTEFKPPKPGEDCVIETRATLMPLGKETLDFLMALLRSEFSAKKPS